MGAGSVVHLDGCTGRWALSVIEIELDDTDDSLDRAFDAIIKAYADNADAQILVYGDDKERLEVLMDLLNKIGNQPTQD